MIFLYDQYFLYKPLFPSSQPSKTLKIESAISKSTWGLTQRAESPLRATQRISGYFFVFFSGKLKHRFFLDSRDQNKIQFFFDFLYMTSISYINHYFRAPSPLKPLKSRPQGQNLPGFPLIAHSDHQGPVSAQFCRLSCLF